MSPPLSRFRVFRLARGWCAAAFLPAAALVLLLGAGTAQAQTAPGFSSATVDGLKVTVNFNGDLKTGDAGSCAALGAWTVNVDGTDFAPTSLRCETRSVTIWLSEWSTSSSGVTHNTPSPPRSGHTYKVSYDKTRATITINATTSGPLKGAASGNPEVANFTGQPVSNPNPGPRYHPPDPYTPPPSLSVNATVNGKTMTVQLPSLLDESSVPAGSAFTVTTHHGGGAGIRDCRGFCTVAVSAVSLSGQVLTLTLEETIPHGADVGLRYTPPSANPLREPNGGTAVRLDVGSVTVETPDTAPVFSRAALSPSAEGESRYLYVLFNELLDEDSQTADRAFTVTARSSSGRTRTVAGTRTGTVTVNGSMVAVELASPVTHGETVTVRYVKPTANPLRDRAGKAVESFSGKPVTAGTPSIVSVALSSDPGRDRTYGLGDTVRVQVTFSGPVQVTGKPRQELSMGQRHPAGSPPDYPRGGAYFPWADYESGSGTPTLTFAYTVKELDRTYTGLSVWHNLDLNGGKIRALIPWSYPRYDADVSHDWLRYDANHKVDGTLPTFRSAGVDYRTLVMTFNGNLDADSVPAPSAFRVTVNGARRSVAAGGVVVSGAAVRLTLASAVTTADTVKVRYTRPSANPLRSIHGAAVETFSDQEVADSLSLSWDGWSATLTAQKPGDQIAGCSDSFASLASCSDRLTDNSLTIGSGVPYRITGVYQTIPADGVWRLYLAADQAIPLDWVLHVDDRPFPVATRFDDNRTAIWNFGPNSWTDGQKVSLRLTSVAGPRPSFRSAAVDGKTLTVTFDGNLDPASVPAPGDFHVTVNNVRRSVATGGVAISGAEVRLTLASTVNGTDTVKVRYNRPSAGPLQSTSGNAVDTFTDQAVANNTPMWSATLTAQKPGDQIAGCSDSFASLASCSDRLTDNSLTIGSGVPYRITGVYQTIPADGVWRLYLAADQAIPLDWVLHVDDRPFPVATRFDDNRTAIWNFGPNSWTDGQKVSLRLTTGGGGASGDSASADSVSVTEVEVISGAGPDNTYALGETINVRVTFSEAVDVTGTPRLKIDMDPAHWGEKLVAYESGSGTNTLVFAHEVVEPNISTQGIAVLANTLEFNGGTIRSGGTDADLAHTGLAHDASHKVNWRLAPESGAGGTGGASGNSAPPSVTAVAVVSDPGADKTYLLGDKIRIRARFSEAVTVTGTPGLSIDMDPAHWGTKRAAYESGSGTRNLTFSHTVVEPNYSTQGIAVLANTLALGGGTIRSASGTNAALAHSGLGHDSGHKVDWRPEISVADAQANEGAGSISFEVSLSRAFTSSEHRVTVDYATANGTATAGEDYTATSGTLTFAAGDSSKTVSVAVLDDAVDEGEETFSLRLSDVEGAREGDLEATGTIANDDPMPKAWLARFGRSVAVHVVDAVEMRLQGATDSWGQLGGQRLGGGPDVHDTVQRLETDRSLWDEPVVDPVGQDVSFRDLLLGSAFHLVSNPEDEVAGPRLSAWGRVATGGFDGREDQVSLEGTVTTATLGVDGVWKRWLTGLLLAYSEGDGSFTHLDMPGGNLESSLTSVHPYVAYTLSDRVRLWGTVGYGSGALRLRMADRPAMDTDLTMTMGALGVRGSLLNPSHRSGVELALRSDVLWMVMDSAAADNLAATEADVSRLRLMLEGSRSVALAGGGSLVPSLEIGLRRDGGDAETGTGIEVGGRLRYASSWGLSIEASVRGLLAHEAEDYTEWGASGALRFDPGRQGRGLTAPIMPTWGTASSGMSRLWDQSTAAGLAPDNPLAIAAAEGRLEAQLGYGLATLQGRGLLTPYARVALTEGADQAWHLGTRLALAESLNLSLEASRRAREGESAAHELALRANLGF